MFFLELSCSYPTPEARGGGREDPMPEGRQPRGVTPRPRSGAVAKSARRNINNLTYTDDTTLMAESEEELKSLLKVKEESEKLA